ncbi:Metallo-dependent hydrolase [Trematosphaeria pertusa]|uniref:Metallo-dependent hydrolase n=1 Tax=Trematosphaeria pertusa TaxID=390896 RepID=A0A6A6I6C7_9PLEO|nr:Metallo-dependent hydrolase [Trematosphaeria pertusa]KAF2245779.1 Metallo-dependent hydrolase [Trematosphaeria pertusa]
MPHENDAEPFPWHLGVYDAHCHPTDTMSSIESIPSMKTRVLTIMATRAEDQSLVSSVAATHSVKSADPAKWAREECIVPYRQIFLSLPNPTPFSAFLAQTRNYLAQHPLALIGEIGLDRSFRIPEAWNLAHASKRNGSLTPGGREGRRLTPFRCQPKHQKAIFKKQLELAAEYGRGVSVHGVQAHGMVYDALKELWAGHERPVLSKRERKKRGRDDPNVEAELDASNGGRNNGPKPYPPRVCLHSYSGSPANFKQYLNPAIPVELFASFSTAINLGDAVGDETPKAFEEMIKIVPDRMLLVESDLHCAGEEMDRRLEDMVRRICRIKGWGLEEGVKILGRNWRRFVFGTEP